PQRRLGAEEAMKIPRRQSEELAITQGHDIGVAAIGNKESELAEKIAAAELNGGGRDPHFDRAGRNEIHRVATLTLADDDLVGNGEARPQQTSDGVTSLRIESSKHRHATDQILALQPEVESRPCLDNAPARPQLALQVLIDFLVDHRFRTQPAIAVF